MSVEAVAIDAEEPELRIDVAAAVHKHLPEKQRPCGSGFSQSRLLTDFDLYTLAGRGIAERTITGLADKLFADLAIGAVRRLVNAGPHVVDIKAGFERDAELLGIRVFASTPAIPARTYGAEVRRDELAVSRVGVRADRTVTAMRPTLWDRIQAAWAATETDAWMLGYDGPRGWRDAA